VNILHLNHAGSHIGGVEGYIANVASALEKAGHRSHLVYFGPSDADKLIANTTYVPLSDWPGPSAQAERILEQVIARFRPDIAYIHAVYHPTVVEWVSRRLPAVAYVHGPYLVCPGSAQYLRNRAQVCPYKAGVLCLVHAQTERCCWGRNPLAHVRLLRRVRAFVKAYRQVRHVFVGSRYMLHLLRRGGIASEKLSILPPVLFEGPLPSLSSVTDARTVLFAARLMPEKGLALLIRALATIESDWQLVVAGEGAERPSCEALARRLGIADRVRFVGWLSASEMESSLQECACVAVPSLWPEPFGRLGPEAFCHGRPVVAFAVGGIPDWLEDGLSGYLVSPGNVNGLAQSLQSLLDSPEECQRMGRYARQKALSLWTAEGHLDRLLATFENALN
jgi:glycosyltransferase involved in cell wall biosynthesis